MTNTTKFETEIAAAELVDGHIVKTDLSGWRVVQSIEPFQTVALGPGVLVQFYSGLVQIYSTFEKLEVSTEILHWIEEAKKHDIELAPRQFDLDGMDAYLDGMDPGEWLDAMTME